MLYNAFKFLHQIFLKIMDIFSKLNKIIITIIIINIIIIIIIDIIIIAKRSRNTSRLNTPISIKVPPVNHVSWPAVHHGKLFCSEKFSLAHVH